MDPGRMETLTDTGVAIANPNMPLLSEPDVPDPLDELVPVAAVPAVEVAEEPDPAVAARVVAFDH
jgi:hypothetical protein